MKPFQLKSETLWVRRTGLPFYDAARVIGVAQLFFGTTEAQVRETGLGWELVGIADNSNAANVLQRLWITERSYNLRPLKRGAFVYDYAQQWQINFLGKWNDVRAYFTNTSTAKSKLQKGVYYEIDVALQNGTRGVDPKSYSNFASGSGTPMEEPEPEVLAALIGYSHAAQITAEREDFFFLLPIFGNLPRLSRNWSSINTAHYWNYNEYFSHDAGEQVAATLAMILMLDTLYSAKMPVNDFAFNSRTGPTYRSGTLEADKLCLFWRTGCDGVLREIGSFLYYTRNWKQNPKAMREKPHVFELARILHDFVRCPAVDSLERIVRLKARATAENDLRTNQLLDNRNHIQQMLKMTEEAMSNSYIYKPSENLCRMVAHALATPKEDSPTTVPPDGWIGRYLKLENASNSKRFVEEIERLLSRATMAANAHENMLKALREDPEREGTSLTEIRENLSSSQEFRAFRAEFLLIVLHIIARDRDYLAGRKRNKPQSNDLTF